VTSRKSRSWLENLAAVDLSADNNSSNNDHGNNNNSKLCGCQSIGRPPDSVRHNMVVAEVDQNRIDAVLGQRGGSSSSSTNNNDVCHRTSGRCRHETLEDALADHYRKMKRLGMLDDAVRYKMIVNEVDPKIIAAVFNGTMDMGHEEASAPRHHQARSFTRRGQLY
jgi:hypothetical protein